MSMRRRAIMKMGENIRRRVARGECNFHTVEAEGQKLGASLVKSIKDSDGLIDQIESGALSFAQSADQWASCGFPLVDLSHRLAASLMATSIPTENVNDVVTPWESFVIVVPRGLIEDIEFLSVDRGPSGRQQIRTQFEENGFMVGWEADGIRNMAHGTNGASGHSEILDRGGRLLGRLALGVCIELDQPRYREQIALGPRRRSVRRESDEPKAWTFQLTRPVKVDCREWVTTYLNGNKGTSPSVQTLVRGHHKMQPHGPGKALRKWIHIEPYWRGPEDAPIAVRAHVL